MTDFVACFLRKGGEILLGRRADGGAERGRESADDAAGERDAEGGAGDRWDVVHEAVGADPETTAVDAAERIVDDATLVRTGDPVYLEDDGVLYPYLFDVSVPLLRHGASERPTTDGEASPDGTALRDAFDETEWAAPTELLRRESAPGRWRAYEVVAPTVRSVAADDEHGSAYLSLRALEVLRDRAATVADEGGDDVDELVDLAARLRRARPSMAALHNRAVAESDGTPAGIEAAAVEGIERARRADADAARRADDAAVLTLSHSGTVLSALRDADLREPFVAESRPENEGVAVAESLAGDRPVTLHTDAATARVLHEASVDIVLVGADTVLPDGSVVNKTGTRAAVYDGDAPLDVRNPTFDVTPPDLVDGVVTERGVLSLDEVSSVADELRDLAERAESPDGAR